uniref:Uncharacterized protein n=1 Tax=Aegilops tauschii subsp. strangulata TaxID=200361 RepID=A0A453BK89_AEGTS
MGHKTRCRLDRAYTGVGNTSRARRRTCLVGAAADGDGGQRVVLREDDLLRNPIHRHHAIIVRTGTSVIVEIVDKIHLQLLSLCLLRNPIHMIPLVFLNLMGNKQSSNIPREENYLKAAL